MMHSVQEGLYGELLLTPQTVVVEGSSKLNPLKRKQN